MSEKKEYIVSWMKGREVGAIGIFYPGHVQVSAASLEDALLEAYETHDHLMFVKAWLVDDPRRVWSLWCGRWSEEQSPWDTPHEEGE